MLKFFFNGSPNPLKIALFLEESGLAYQPVPIDAFRGDQFKPDYLAINPNGKVPAIDDDGVIVFDSNAILLYLAEKTGKFLPPRTPAHRAELLSWLMFVASGGDDGYGAFPHLKRLVDEIWARPAAARAMALKDRFTFTSGLDDEGRRHMFKHAQTAGG